MTTMQLLRSVTDSTTANVIANAYRTFMQDSVAMQNESFDDFYYDYYLEFYAGEELTYEVQRELVDILEF